MLPDRMNLDMQVGGLIGTFVNCGADPGEIAICEYGNPYLGQLQELKLRRFTECRLILIANAMYLLKRRFGSCFAKSGLGEHPKFKGVAPFRKALLVQNQPGYYYQVTTDKGSEYLLESVEWTSEDGRCDTRVKILGQRIEEVYIHLAKEKEKVNLLEYLAAKGYYKYPDDPAVPRAPFERFKQKRKE